MFSERDRRRLPSVEKIQELTFDDCPSGPRERANAWSAFCAAAPGESAATSTVIVGGIDRSITRAGQGWFRT